MGRMKVVQVGVGGFGRHWVRVLRDSKDVRVAGLVDLRRDAIDAARQEIGDAGVPGFESLTAALRAVAADAAVIVTPPERHRPLAEQAMRAGLHVITEKPMAATPADCASMLRTAASTGRVCVVSQNYRYRPELWTMAALVRRGAIGDIGQVRLEFFKGQDFHGGFRHSMPYPLLIDMSIHHFDLIRFITGLDPVAVRGEAWNPPWSNYAGDCSSAVTFEMNNGARVLYNGSWCSKGAYCDWNGNWHIEGSKGCLTYANGQVVLHSVPALYTETRQRAVALKPLKPDGQARVLKDFTAAVRRGRRPPTDVRDNIRSVAMVFAAVEAVKTGRRVPVLDARMKAALASAERRDQGT